jgi:hypothetical protein
MKAVDESHHHIYQGLRVHYGPAPRLATEKTSLATYRDLTIPQRAETWRLQRGTRTTPPRAAVGDKARAATFQAALEQSQQFMEAAETAGYATRALQLFYALSQGGRAIAAVSPRLPGAIQIPDRNNPGQTKTIAVPWQLRGHGIVAPAINVRRVSKITVSADWTGLMSGVALAMGVDCLKPEQRIQLAALWPLLPESFQVPLTTAPQFPALSIEGGYEPPKPGQTHHNVNVGYIPDSVHTEYGADNSKLAEFLRHYPSLSGWRCTRGVDEPLDWERHGPNNEHWRLSLSRPISSPTDNAKPTREMAGTRCRPRTRRSTPESQPKGQQPLSSPQRNHAVAAAVACPRPGWLSCIVDTPANGPSATPRCCSSRRGPTPVTMVGAGRR